MRTVYLRAFLTPICALFMIPSAFSELLYRYQDDQGGIILNTYVPPEYVALGYTVLNDQGMVVKVVPPALTQAQREQQQLERSRELALDEAMHLQKANDEMLLRLYSTPEDVQRALNRKLQSIDIFIQSKRNTLTSLELQKRKIEEKAANLERTGEAVPTYLSGEIYKIKRLISDSKVIIKKQEAEKKRQSHIFNKDLQRLKELTVQLSELPPSSS